MRKTLIVPGLSKYHSWSMGSIPSKRLQGTNNKTAKRQKKKKKKKEKKKKEREEIGPNELQKKAQWASIKKRPIG